MMTWGRARGASRASRCSRRLERYAYCASICPVARDAPELFARLAAWRFTR